MFMVLRGLKVIKLHFKSFWFVHKQRQTGLFRYLVFFYYDQGISIINYKFPVYCIMSPAIAFLIHGLMYLVWHHKIEWGFQNIVSFDTSK